LRGSEDAGTEMGMKKVIEMIEASEVTRV